MKHLITLEDIGRLARACYADEDIAASLISEAERQDIKPKIGDALFIRITQDNPPAGYDVLLDGGEWSDSQGNARYLTGLRTALAYYAYGRIIRDGNIQSTRYGAVVKTEDNSAESERNERARQYREAFTAADGYMMEVLDYLGANACSFPEYRCAPVRANRSILRILDGEARLEPRKAQIPTVIAGQPGESAYDIAVANGFRGTVEDWLESLRGEPGASPKGLMLEYKEGELTADELSAIGAVLDTWEANGRPPLWLQAEGREFLPLSVAKDEKGFESLATFFSVDVDGRAQAQRVYSFDRGAKQWTHTDYLVGADPVTTERINDGAVTEAKIADGSITGKKFSAGLVAYMGRQFSYFKQVQVAYGEDPSAAIKSFVQRDYKTALYIKLSNGLLVPANTNGETVAGVYSYGDDVYKVLWDGTAWSNKVIQKATIDSAHLGDGSVTSTKIANYAVAGPKISPAAISTDKLVDEAVTKEKIADGAITREKIAAGAVVNSKIADGTIGSDKIAAGAVTNSHIKDSTISKAKLSEELQALLSINEAQTAQARADISRLAAQQPAEDDGSALPLLCGQPPILFGAGTPKESVVPSNWRQFDPETGEGYNWTGLPSAIGQQYINTEASSGGRYIAVRDGMTALKWLNC